MSTADTNRIQQAVRESIDHNRRDHQQWHWNTGDTNCPWGCGDGSGITDAQ